MRLKSTLYFLFFVFVFTPNTNKAQSFMAGDVVFIGFNSDSTDHLALVTFVSIPANTTLYIRDDEWNGTAFTTGEGTLAWNSGTTAISAGTVILLNELSDTTKLNANIGTVTRASTTAFNIAGSNEGVFLYTGTNGNTPTTFLSAILNGTIATAGTTLSGTGLTVGTNAYVLTDAIDIAAYKGPRTGFDRNGYLAEIGKLTNWDQQDGSGNQSKDGIAPEIPFSTTPFVVFTADVTPPSVIAANVTNKTTVSAKLSEKITKASAETLANYTFTPALTISAVAYDSVNLTVTLTTAGLVSGTRYVLSVNNLTDNAGNKQTQISRIDKLYFNEYAGSDLVITEIMYNLGGGDSLEFIELYNRGTGNIPLGGLVLVGVDGTISQFSLPAKGFALICSDSGACARLYGVSPIYTWESDFLSNGGEKIEIRNSLGGVLDSVTYDDEAPWFLEADGRGTSLEVIDPDKDNGVVTNWRASKTPLNKKVGFIDVFCSPGRLPTLIPVKEIPKALDFTLSPNPVWGNEIQFNRDIKGTISDISGRLMLRFEKTTILNIATLPNGLYFLNTSDGVTKKFVVQK